MARTKPGQNQRTPTAVVNCLKAADPAQLEELTKSIGTDFLKSDKSIQVREIDVPVIAYFCSKGKASCVQKCLELEPTEANLRTALHHSINESNLACVKLVLDAHQTRGDDPEKVSSMQSTGGLRAIIFAAQVGLDILKEVCEHENVGMGEIILGKSRVTKDHFINKTPLDLVYDGSIVDYLCERWKQDPNDGIIETECDYPRPLHRAAAYAAKFSIIERLVANGAHVNANCVNFNPVIGKPIHILCSNTKMPYNEMLKSIRVLVASGADPSAPSLLAKKTPLSIALAYKTVACIDYLIVEAKVADTDIGMVDAPAKALLDKAKELRDSGLTQVPFEDDEAKSKQAREGTIQLEGYHGDGLIRSAECRLNAETFELTSSQEWRGDDGGLKEKARKVALCLKGVALNSDGSYAWEPFWAMDDPERRASRRISEEVKFRNTILFALGSDATAQANFVTMLNTGNRNSVLLDHLGWDEESIKEGLPCDINLDTLTDAEARALDRGDRLAILLKALEKPIICARFKNAMSFPVFVGAVTSSGVYGCFATRVDT